MKVKDLIAELAKFNQEAEVNVVAHCKKEEFTLTWESGDAEELADTKKDTKSVSLYVDRLCGREEG